ncbi:MAG: HAMP domain-containing histidine kinase [Spirochaetales bacterium]|nr:HAMP domain-containing histidine kinase [Spirochaetales bacterium]
MFRSFYARISLLFLLLILILGTASLFIAFNASRHLFDEVEQLLNREYAASIAAELKPLTDGKISDVAIGEAIHYMMVLNPMVEIYLVDSRGHIISYFAGGKDPVLRREIDTAPLVRFQESRGYETLLGDDPRTKSSRKPFSASPLEINGEQGWVYVILRGQSYDHSLALVRTDYYTRSGLFTFLLAMVITLAAGFFLFFILTYRLRSLDLGVQAFKKGQFDHRIAIRGNDELASLGRAFNEMAESIAQGIEKLHEADRQKSDLIANISHDLRSPLASIRGHLESLQLSENRLSEKEREEYIAITLRNVAGFQNLVEELLDLARLEARQISPEKVDFSLAELVQDAVLKVSHRAREKEISLAYEPDGDLPLFPGDIGLIERAVTNVLDNALDHTPEGGKVSVTLDQTGEGFSLAVSDTGEGIAEEDLPYIFERFYRADKSRTRKASSTGLGLAIAREVVELHGGKICADNLPRGGARFVLTLPGTV